MQTKPVRQKIIAIDLLRALAALGVFSFHNHMGTLLVKYSVLKFLKVTDALGAIYAVPLFFLISGYCIHASNLKYLKANQPLPLKEYCRRRFLRIYPPYFAALLFSVVVNYLVIDNYQLNIYDGIVHFFSLQGFTTSYFNTINLVLWTISVELAFYAIYPVFYYIRFRYNLNYALALTFIVSCISIGSFTLSGYSLPERFCVFNLWFAWCIGAYLADKKILGTTNFTKPGYLVLYLLILLIFVYLNYTNSSLSIIQDQLNILIWTAPMLFLLSKEDWLRRKQHTWIIRLFAAIGLSSYSLYLLHEPLITLKNFLVHRYFPVSFQLAGVVVGILIIPVVAWYSYYYIEKPFIFKKRLG